MDGDREPWIYSYLGGGNSGSTPFSIGSSSSGTIVSISTGDYTSGGSGSGLSSFPIPMEAARPLFNYGNYAKLTNIQKKQQIKSLVQEFFGGEPSADCSIIEGGGNMSVLERWFSDLGVGWVLQLVDRGVASAVMLELDFSSYARSWVSGLFQIKETIGLMVRPFSEINNGGGVNIVTGFQFAQFIKEAMLKILPSVDAMVAWSAETTKRASVTKGRLPPSYDDLSSLVSMHGVLSEALQDIYLLVYSLKGEVNRIAELTRIAGELGSFLSEKKAKVAGAVSSTLTWIDSEITWYLNVACSLSSQGSSDIHMATRSVMRYINFMQSNYTSMDPILSKAVLASPPDKSVHPLDITTVKMTSRLEDKLVKLSESFPDQGLRFLFLLNNLYFVQESLLFFTLLKKTGNKDRRQRYSYLDVHMAALFEKVDRAMENYVQESWEPVLSCLFSPPRTPLGLLMTRNSVLPKFESAFRKTYTTQKLWKVPDPKLRKSLRTTIIEKIIPDYTQYIEENNIATPEFTPKEMEEMLQELFEG